MSLHLEIVTNPSRMMIETIAKFRVKIYSEMDMVLPETYVKDGLWIEEQDLKPNTVFFNLYEGNELIGTARASMHSKLQDIPEPELIGLGFLERATFPLCSIGRICMSEKYRGNGTSKILSTARLQYGLEKGAKTFLVGTVRHKHVRSLENLGFVLAYHSRDSVLNPLGDGRYFLTATAAAVADAVGNKDSISA